MIYVVLNTEDYNEPFVLSICTDEETAQKIVDKTRENFVKNVGYSEDEVSFIDYVILDTSVKTSIVWSAYDDIESSIQ